MTVEYIVAFYMLVCVMMTLFNFGFLFYEKVRTRRFERRMAKLAVELGDEIERNVDFPTEEHRRHLVRSMRFLSGLEAFDLTVENLARLDDEKCARYLIGVSSVFDRLARMFANKDDLKCAYFAYVARRWYQQRPPSEAVSEALVRYVRDRSFYARQNSLQAIAAICDAPTLVSAIELLEQRDEFHHPKLVTETLLEFSGDRAQLVDLTIERFSSFDSAVQTAVVNFVRMSDVRILAEAAQGVSLENALVKRPVPESVKRHREWALEILCDKSADREVRLAAVRYFMSCRWKRAASELRALARTDGPKEWEFAAVAATALASYPGEETTEVLVRCLSSRSWYVRHNAAKSLHDLGATAGDLQEVLEGDDPYAIDMLRYRWQLEGELARPDASMVPVAAELAEGGERA